MKKIVYFMLMAVVSLGMTSCGEDHPYDDWHHPNNYNGNNSADNGGNYGSGQTGSLNQYEQQLVGSFVSTDDDNDVFYLTLSQDRTGNFVHRVGGQVTEQRTFTWWANQSQLNISYTDQNGGTDQMGYSIAGSNYVFGDIPYRRAAADDSAQTTTLSTQWRGSLLTYYKDIYQLDGDKYATVMQFMADSEQALTGTGWQLDFQVDSADVNYAYNPYIWTIQGDTAIVLNYIGGSTLSPAVIKHYKTTETDFRGQFSYLAPTGTKTVDFNFIRTIGVTVPTRSVQTARIQVAGVKSLFDTSAMAQQMPTAIAKTGGSFATR